jgi:hypothetical protein
MQCPQCGKTGFVTLGGKRFCSNCGANLGAAAAPMTTMADIKLKGKTLDLRSSTPTPTKSAAAVTAAAGRSKPAGQFHGQQVDTASVLDLRTHTAPMAAPAPTATATPTPKTQKSVAPVAAPVAPVVTPPAAPTLRPATIAPKQPIAKPLPAPNPAAPVVAAAAGSIIAPASNPMINRYPEHPAVAQPSASVLPEAIAAQVDTMKAQSASAPLPPQPQSPALQQALAAAKQSTAVPSMLKIGAALVAIAIMGGVVWLQNSPKLAFRNAASQAGIAASLPTYIPSSYHQVGPVSASPGTLTLNFSSPSDGQPLKITQRRSDWDANALRENYVASQSTGFLAVQGQGLTIYMFGDQANWVNHGVWYQLSGTSKLGREDILKIAYGL